MKEKILFSDNLHFHKRNFKSLIDFVENQNFDIEYNVEHRDWMALYGDYSDKFSSLSAYYGLLERLTKEELFDYQVRNINVYDVAKAELLAFLIPVKELYKLDITDDNQEVYGFVYDNCREELLLNMSAALFWLDFWYNKIVVNKKKYNRVITFSGSNIYSKSLVKVCQSTISRVYVAETSLTGNDYYLEEKNSHIANNSDIKLLAVQKKHMASLADDENPYNTKIKAINKLNLSNNKNVTQPYSDFEEVKFDNENDIVTILGQVVNDYSVIETEFGFLSTVHVYKLAIRNIIDNTNYNVIFKSHPWEEKKTNCDFDITYQEILKFVEDEIAEKDRVKLVKDFDVNTLYQESKHIVLLNSQSGIEAAGFGIKPIVLGKAFYGGFGFTNDCSNIGELSQILNDTDGSLSLEEFDRYQLFLTLYLEKHLFSVNPSGQKKLREEIFSSYKLIPISKRKLPVKVEAEAQSSNEAVSDENSVVNELMELSTATQIKNGIVYFFTDFEKFKKKLKNKL